MALRAVVVVKMAKRIWKPSLEVRENLETLCK